MPIIDCRAHYGPLPPFPAMEVDQVEALMGRLGVEKCILASTLALAGDLDGGNQALASVIAGRDALLGYLVLSPSLPELSLEQMRRHLHGKGFAGALVWLGDSSPLAMGAVRQILKSLLRYDKPLLVGLGPGAEVEQVLDLAGEYPTATLILAEMGGWRWPLAIQAARQAPNLYLEVGGPPERDKIGSAVEAVGAHRLLFASLLPMTSPAFAAGMVRDADISPSDREKIFQRNAQKVFGI